MSSDGTSDRRPKHLGRGVLFALSIHGAILFPLLVVVFVMAAREDARHADEVSMSFEEVAPGDLPSDLPPLDQPAPKPKKKATTLAEEKVKPAEKDVEPEEMPKPVAETPEEQPPPPPPPKVERQHEKMVDLDMGKEVEPPPEAKYLAEKNNRAEVETRAERTNLEREQKGGESSSPSDNKDKDVGDDKDKVARLEDQKSKQGREAPDVTPHVKQELAQAPAEERRSLLAMRDLAKRLHEVTPETVDPSLPADPDGMRELPEQDLRTMKDLKGRAGQAAKMSLRLSGKQYHYLFGEDAEAAERFAQTQKSKKVGRFAARLGRVQSALENFIPEVKPGNQTALNTRAAPFAAYIARMHRNIHELWGFGFLSDLESKPESYPLNNRDLMAKLEIVLKGDGTVDKVTVVRSSGMVMFDAQAIDVVYSAGPYADPPRAIRSANGKIYIHWTFHRDDRQCATSGVDYFILDNAPAGGDKGESTVAEAPEPAGKPALPAPASGDGGGPRRLERGFPGPGRTAAHRGRELAHGREPVEERVPERTPEPSPGASRQAIEQVAHPDDPGAHAAAEQWFDAYARGDVATMIQHASFPFRSREDVAARTRDELKVLLRDLLGESAAERRPRSLELFTAARIRTVLGSIPPGFREGTGLLFAVAKTTEATFILVLAKEAGAWRAVGLVRL